MPRIRSFCIIALTAFLFLGCENIPFFPKSKPVKKPPSSNKAPAGEIIAQVGNFYVTADDLDREVEVYNKLVQPKDKIDTRDKKINYLRNEVVRKYILYQEALDRRLDGKADLQQALENYKISLLVGELINEEFKKIEVTSEEIESFYDAHKDIFREPEQRRIYELVTASEQDAKQAYIELLKGGDFAALAKQYSKSTSAGNGGDLGFVILESDPQKRIRSNKFYEIAFSPSLEIGSISNIFQETDGYYIIKVQGIKKSEPKSLSAVWDDIKAWLLFERQQKAIADLASRLTGETKIEIYEGRVK